jgi:hypothetical protein
LCTLKLVQKKEAGTAAATEASNARPQAADIGKTGRPEPPRQKVCAESVFALGLCTQTPI